MHDSIVLCPALFKSEEISSKNFLLPLQATSSAFFFASCSICSHESCINTSVFNISESKRDLPDVAVLPAAENTLSDDADVAGIHNTRFASALSNGNLFYT